jgi:hypothetical protein
MMSTIQQRPQNKEIIDYLIDALHDYPRSNRNIEFENFLILQSKVERKLISIINEGKYEKVFSKKIIEQINTNICGNFINNIIENKIYSLDLFFDLRDVRDIYGGYPFNTKLHLIKDRRCLFLPLFALANNISYEEATFYWADYFKIEYADCADAEPVFENEDSKRKASYSYLQYDFFNKENEATFYVSKLSISNETVILPYTQDYYIVPKKLPLLNLNLIHYNPDAIIFLTDSIPLAFEQQKKYTDQYIREKLEKQKKYWELEEEEFRKASKLYRHKGTEVRDRLNPFFCYMTEAKNVNSEIDNMLSGTRKLSKYNTNIAFYLQTDIVWTAWYKELLTVKRVDWSPLQDRRVNYIHFGKLDKNTLFEKMLAVYAEIYAQTGGALELQFIYLPSAANIIEKNKNGTEFYSPNELLMDAHNAGVMIPEILQDKLDELLRKLRKNKKEKFLFDPIIGNKSFNLLLGKRGSGKSWVGMSIAYSLATGRSFIKSWNVPKPCKVLYINGEVDEELMDDRCYILDKMYGKSVKKKNVIFRTDKELDLTTPESQVKVEKYLNTASLKEGDNNMPVSVLVLDNLYFLALNAEKEKKWDVLKDWILKIIREKKISVLLLHHSNEDNRSFGTSNIEKVADDVLLFKKGKKQENGKNYLKIKFEETKNKRKLEFEPFDIFLDTGKRPKWIEDNDESKEVLNWKMGEPEKKNIVVELRNKNNTWPDIAVMFGVSLSSIEKYAQASGISESNKKIDKNTAKATGNV